MRKFVVVDKWASSYDSYEKAASAAGVLAKEKPGQSFYVFALVAEAKAVVSEVTVTIIS